MTDRYADFLKEDFHQQIALLDDPSSQKAFQQAVMTKTSQRKLIDIKALIIGVTSIIGALIAMTQIKKLIPSVQNVVAIDHPELADTASQAFINTHGSMIIMSFIFIAILLLTAAMQPDHF